MTDLNGLLGNFPDFEKTVPVSVVNKRDETIAALTQKNKALETRLEMYRACCTCKSQVEAEPQEAHVSANV